MSDVDTANSAGRLDNTDNIGATEMTWLIGAAAIVGLVLVWLLACYIARKLPTGGFGPN